MPQRRHVLKVFAAMGIVSLVAGSNFAVAQNQQNQQTQELPPGSVTFPVHFPTGSSTLGAEDQDTIRAVAAKLRNDPKLIATIIGKADSVGSPDFNMHLSQKRTEAAFESLVYTNNIPENRVQMQFTGEHLPFVATSDEQAERQNRVVAIILHE